MINQVYVGIGSNIDRDNNIRGGIEELKSCFGELEVSPVYQSKSFGFEGDDFYNLVAGFKTDLSIDIVSSKLREIEFKFGRKRNETRYSSRTLDIDLLLFNDLVSNEYDVPREDIEKYAFVLKPLCDLSPEQLHPVIRKNVNELWKQFDKSTQSLTEIKIDLE